MINWDEDKRTVSKGRLGMGLRLANLWHSFALQGNLFLLNLFNIIMVHYQVIDTSLIQERPFLLVLILSFLTNHLHQALKDSLRLIILLSRSNAQRGGTCLIAEQSQGLPVSPAEFGVEGEFAWLPCEDALAAFTAVLAAYMLASSWNLPMFFLYLILLFPNQLETWADKQERVV